MSDFSTNVFLLLYQCPGCGEAQFRCLSSDDLSELEEALTPREFNERFCGGVPLTSYEVKGLVGSDLRLLMDGIESWFDSYLEGSGASMTDALAAFDESCLGLSEVLLAA
nr:hypothetical protein 3 [Paracoccaceae bacterium]